VRLYPCPTVAVSDAQHAVLCVGADVDGCVTSWQRGGPGPGERHAEG